MRKLDKLIADQERKARTHARTMWAEYGGHQLTEAVDAGQLTIHLDWINGVFERGNIDQQAMVSILRERISESGGALMFDTMMGGVVDAAEQEQKIHIDVANRHGIRRTTTGTAMISYLPTFPQASIGDILEAKETINAPLTEYKATVATLERRIRNSSLSKGELDEELSFLWHDEVEPKTRELTNALYDTELPRLSSALKGAAYGASIPGITFVVAGGVGHYLDISVDDISHAADVLSSAGIDIPSSVSAAATASVGGAISGAISGWKATAKSIKKLSSGGLYYLADTSRSLETVRRRKR